MRIDWNRYRSFVYGTWEPDVVRTLAKLVSPGDAVLDIGAHIGFYTLLLARLVGPKGQVVAFEPLPGNFEILAENIRLNQCSQVRAINKAVMGSGGKLEVTLSQDEPLPGGTSMLNDHGGQQVAVDAVSLDEFFGSARVPLSLIKMDVEGAEEQVLRGGRKTIESLHPTLVIEVHHFDCQREEHPVLALLRDWHYELRWVNRWALTSHLVAQWKA